MKISYPQSENHFKAEDFGFDQKNVGINYLLRPSIYALVFDEMGKIASVSYRKEVGNIYPLPGGGINEGETWEQGLTREIKEEIGCDIKDIKPLGSFDSYDNSTNQKFQSIICTANLEGDPENPESMEDYEQGSKLIWLTKEEVICNLQEIAGPQDNLRDCRSYMTLEILRTSPL